MDKYEYRIKAEQIVKLFGRKDYATAMKIADGIDWNRVKNVQMLCTVSEVYEKNKKYEESRDILLLAYDRSPIGRMIVYRLVELSILLEEFDEAIAYYKEYEQIAPNDTNIYILKYKIYKGRGATIETLISILEEFKRKDYHEEWALELARLYHEGGYVEKCIEECDEIDLWFNKGPSVIAALELKMCHCPLTPSQEEKYARRDEENNEEVEDLEMLLKKSEEDEPSEEQMEKERSESREEESLRKMDEELSAESFHLKEEDLIELKSSYESEFAAKAEEEDISLPLFADVEKEANKYDTLNLQKELSRSIQKLLNATEKKTVDATLQNVKKMVEDSHIPELTETMRFRTVRSEMLNKVARERAKELEAVAELADRTICQKEEIQDNQCDRIRKVECTHQVPDIRERPVAEPTLKLKLTKQEKRKNLERILTQESDGQISLLIPEEKEIEEQIAGQMSIEDIIREREKQKLLSENDRDKLALEEARKRALEETQEIMNEIMGLLKDVIPKIGSLKDGEEKMASLANSLEKVQNSLPAFSKDLLQDAENIKEEVVSAHMQACTSEPDKEEQSEELQEEVIEEDILEPETEQPEEDLLESKADEFHEEEEGLEATAGNEENEEHEWLQKAFVEMQKSIQEEDAGSNVQEMEPDFTTEQTALQELFTADNHTEEEPISEDDYENETEIAVTTNETETEPEPEETSDEEIDLNEEQREIFAYFMSVNGLEKQLIQAIKSAEQGLQNMIITGVAGSGKTSLAMRIVKALQVGKEEKIDLIAKIKGTSLNQKDIWAIFEKIEGGVLIIEKAGTLSSSSMRKLEEVMDEYAGSVQVFLTDRESAIAKLRQHGKAFIERFEVQIDLPVYTNSELVEFGKAYAKVKGYTIDEVGVLALYSQIGFVQTEKQAAALGDVKEIVDRALQVAEKRGKKVLGKLFSRKKQNDNILLESDFNDSVKS